jgi:hypothetical protein
MTFEGASGMDLTFAAVPIREFEKRISNPLPADGMRRLKSYDQPTQAQCFMPDLRPLHNRRRVNRGPLRLAKLPSQSDIYRISNGIVTNPCRAILQSQ